MSRAAQVPLQFRLGPLSTISIGIGLLARGGKGATYRKSKLPDQPIEIWGYEASPFVKLAREVRLGLLLNLLLPCSHQFVPSCDDTCLPMIAVRGQTYMLSSNAQHGCEQTSADILCAVMRCV